MITCPYCQHPVSTFTSSAACSGCGRQILRVPCPECRRPTLNLTSIGRVGVAQCCTCQAEMRELPEPVAPCPTPAPARRGRAARSGLGPEVAMHMRAPRAPILPSAEEACALLEECLVGLERATQDREILRAPDLRALLTGFLNNVTELLALERLMTEGVVCGLWLRDPANLDQVVRLCYLPLWPQEGALLPPAAQAWMLAVDDIARRWQYARRRWLAETCGLTQVPIVAGITTVNPACHHIEGDGSIVLAVNAPGFLLDTTILRKARVQS